MQLPIMYFRIKLIFFVIFLYRPNRNGGPTEAEQLAAASTGELRFSYSLLEKLIHYIDRASINMKLLKPSSTFSRRSSFKICTRDIKFFSKVRLNTILNIFFYGVLHKYYFRLCCHW